MRGWGVKGVSMSELIPTTYLRLLPGVSMSTQFRNQAFWENS